MATPKHKISKSKRDMRRSHLALKNQVTHLCTSCYSSLKLPNTVCNSCGMYNQQNASTDNLLIQELNKKIKK